MAGEFERTLEQERYLEAARDTDLLEIIAEKSWENRFRFDEEDTLQKVVGEVLDAKSRPRVSDWEGSRFAGEIRTLFDFLKDTAEIEGDPHSDYVKDLKKERERGRRTAVVLGHGIIPFDGAERVLVAIVAERVRTSALQAEGRQKRRLP